MDLSKLNVSNGSGEAVRALVTILRAPGGTVITPNSLVNWPTNFVATTGPLLADGTLDPVKTIVFMGHVSGSTFVIDSLAPGYTDTYGSAVDDVVVIKPNTWAQDTLVGAVNTNKTDIATINTTTLPLRQSEGLFNYIASGGVITGDSYAGNRNASMTALVAYINGYRQTVAAVTARTYTASKDTYVDILYNASGVATLVYTEVTNNAASPALAANSIRIGIVVTGASNIAAAGSVNQGQEDKVLPIASSIAYTTTDSLGNLICNRDPQMKLLGLRRIVSNFTVSSGTATLITGLSCPVIVPTGRKVKITLRADSQSYATATGSSYIGIWDTSVAGTRLANQSFTSATASASGGGYCQIPTTPTTSSKTFVGSLNGDGAALSTFAASATSPGFLMVELA